jgi:anoctamin-10
MHKLYRALLLKIIKGTWAWAWTKWFKSPEEPKEVAEIWSYWPLKRLGLLELSSHDPRSRKFETEVILEKYQSTFDDYLELWVQFGYVFLFSAITPMAIFWALTSNIVEIRTDAYKLCNWFQRPFARRAESIGAWQVNITRNVYIYMLHSIKPLFCTFVIKAAFETLGIIAVMTNCVLLSLSPNLRAHAPSFLDGDWTWTIFFVILGLILVSLELYLKWHISDVPPEIKLKFAVQEEAKALRKSASSSSKLLH